MDDVRVVFKVLPDGVLFLNPARFVPIDAATNRVHGYSFIRPLRISWIEGICVRDLILEKLGELKFEVMRTDFTGWTTYFVVGLSEDEFHGVVCDAYEEVSTRVTNLRGRV